MQADPQKGHVLGGRIGCGFGGGDLRRGGLRYGGDGLGIDGSRNCWTGRCFGIRRRRARLAGKRLPVAKPPRKTGRPPRRARRRKPRTGSENASSSDISRQTPPASSPPDAACQTQYCQKRSIALEQSRFGRSADRTLRNLCARSQRIICAQLRLEIRMIARKLAFAAYQFQPPRASRRCIFLPILVFGQQSNVRSFQGIPIILWVCKLSRQRGCARQNAIAAATFRA